MKILRVTCAIILNDGKVFAARRGATQNQPFRWEFPGGKIETGETEEQCLMRELYEELDMKPVILEKLPSFFHNYPEFKIELIPFVCGLPSLKHIAVEHDQTGWFTPQQLLSLEWTLADIPVMEYVVEEVFARYI